ncbi:hypothetical protein IW140_004082 [Coemansia sp. RSA 1813]|nr:hypothetical protein EV178_004130 [Coemansia sp. RSA 1646]KAJ1768958.1 hypothetical protein LPJ74_004444 [Coemansia sp. RSA 1843]KAJ2088321.1 hypothetical protein IW138_004298 [Coemansia sp. RSA 986]KAJ2213339.1 hypothetical protein EV179_003937 [Coemansia sp. RSA 487]KAJ2568176.1 hypothetical protein IW140_004082 [Coemansia sp. RSA 1813]
MSLGVYLFRHIRTRQVLVSTEKSVLGRPQLLKSQIKPNQRPTVIRPDHWTPLVAALGFKNKKAQEEAFMLSSMAGHPLVAPSAHAQREYERMRNKNKRLVDMDMVERQVAQLARTFMYMDTVKSKDGMPIVGDEDGSTIKLLWEDRSWVDKVVDAGLRWPKWIVHGDLDLKRGNIIMNPEVRQSLQ